MLPRQQDFFSKPAKLCQTRCCLVRSHLLYIRYPSSYPRLSGDLLLPSLCHCALRRLSAVIWDETLVDSMLGTLVATFDHPSESIAYIRKPPICSMLVFQPMFWPRKIGYGMIWMQIIFESFWQIWDDLSQAICPSTRVGTGSTRPVRHWVSASLERWCPLAKRRSCCQEKFEGGEVATIAILHHVYCIILSIRIIVASYMMYIII